MHRRWSGLAVSCGLVALAGCSASSPQSLSAGSTGDNNTAAPSAGGSGGDTSGGGRDSSGAAGLPAGSDSPLPGSTVAGDAGGISPGAGVLTAGVWDDGLNFPFFSSYLASHTQIAGDPGFALGDFSAAHAASAQLTPRSVVDVALVIDTTGSMGDEIAYLTAEFAGISGAIASKFPNADQRWALVVYRDTPDYDPGDDYVVKSFDFTGNAANFASTIGAQSAGNGGDYPESPELGLEELGKLTWRTDPSVAKLAFWVADAPHHTERAAAMKKAIVDTENAGIRLYPVSASGTDDLLELTMRSAAELTGGRYLFLTDDSGVGGVHKIPEIPCYFVTRLEKALVRVVSMELAGDYIGPDAADILRVSGNASSDGTCAVEGDGGIVQIF
jgi:hypothetical protein